jgi:hypothetical protein
MRTCFLILILGILASCNLEEKKISTKSTDLITEQKFPIFEFYNPDFVFDSTSNLRTDGYYEVKQIFGTYTTDMKTYHTNKPTYGFVHFFDDGFCRVCSWNGIRKNSAEIESAFQNDKGYIFNGIYQLQTDTVRIEYLYNPASPGAGQTNKRNTLLGLIKENRIDFLICGGIKYSFPQNPQDSLTSSCIGRFRKSEFDKSTWSNYLKDNIDKFIKTEKE